MRKKKQKRKGKGRNGRVHNYGRLFRCRRIEENNSPIRGTISLPRTTLFQEWKKVHCADTYRFRVRHLENEDFHSPRCGIGQQRREFGTRERVINRVNKILKFDCNNVLLLRSPRRCANIDCRTEEEKAACVFVRREENAKDLTLVAFEDGCKNRLVASSRARLSFRPATFK